MEQDGMRGGAAPRMERAAQALCARIGALLEARGRVIAAIDGRCASGKTTLAAELARRMPGTLVLHMDDYFLQPHQRTPQRLAQPGGNVDWERFEREALAPLSRGEAGVLRRYDCAAQALMPERPLPPARVIVAEGSYSLHPALVRYCDLKVMLHIAPQTQRARILARNGEAGWQRFEQIWIPLEEAYFDQTALSARCDVIFCTDGTQEDNHDHRGD